MEPRIQYAKTSDGVSIAYWTLGEGVPLVHLPPMLPFSHIQREWQNPDFGRWYKRLAQRVMLVRYDARGTGMSQREGVSFSLEAFMLDVQAVIDHVGLDRFALLGFLHSGLVALPYTTQSPARVIEAAVHGGGVIDLLPEVKSPTLVFHRRELPVVKVSVAMGLASGIPDAQLVVLKGASAAPYLDERG